MTGQVDALDVVEIPVGEHVALVDAPDVELVSAYHWRPLESQSGKIYALAYSGGRGIYIHRLILGTAAGLDTDHRNGDPLGNRRCNLRPATRSQNLANTSKAQRRNGRPWSSVYKGVTWYRAGSQWQASIRINGHLRYLGRYDSEVEAARAYDAAALATWGEFARPNFPDEVAR